VFEHIWISKVTVFLQNAENLRLTIIDPLRGLEVGKFMCEYSQSQLSITFEEYFRFITADVHPNDTRHIKAYQLELPKAQRSADRILPKGKITKNTYY